LTPKSRKRKNGTGEAIRPVEGDLVESVARRMRLKEGEEAVRRVLREVYRHGKIGTKDIAKATRLPVPVAAAIRRELEREGIIARRGGAVLTEKGTGYVKDKLGFIRGEGLICPVCLGKKIPIPEEHAETLGRLGEYSSRRPRVDTRLDQAYGTPETALRRALYMLEEGDLEGRGVLFLGDDDLTSIAVGLLGIAERIAVVDIDERLTRLISEVSEEEGLGIECILHDLREPLPSELNGVFDTFLTDPPYTLGGLRLFLSRGIEALRGRRTAAVYLAFADKPPLEMLEVHRAITGMGLFVRELIPGFNTYEGAAIIGNTTFMARLSTTEETKPAITGVYTGKIYTGELRPTVRVYRCRCGEDVEVGTGLRFATIEDLKEAGCPRCGKHEGFRMRRRVPRKPS